MLMDRNLHLKPFTPELTQKFNEMLALPFWECHNPFIDYPWKPYFELLESKTDSPKTPWQSAQTLFSEMPDSVLLVELQKALQLEKNLPLVSVLFLTTAITGGLSIYDFLHYNPNSEKWVVACVLKDNLRYCVDHGAFDTLRYNIALFASSLGKSTLNAREDWLKKILWHGILNLYGHTTLTTLTFEKGALHLETFRSFFSQLKEQKSLSWQTLVKKLQEKFPKAYVHFSSEHWFYNNNAPTDTHSLPESSDTSHHTAAISQKETLYFLVASNIFMRLFNLATQATDEQKEVKSSTWVMDERFYDEEVIAEFGKSENFQLHWRVLSLLRLARYEIVLENTPLPEPEATHSIIIGKAEENLVKTLCAHPRPLVNSVKTLCPLPLKHAHHHSEASSISASLSS